MGINWVNGFKTHNELTMYPLGNYPHAPSVSVPVETLEGDALVSSLMSDHTDSPILEGVSGPVVLPQ